MNKRLTQIINQCQKLRAKYGADYEVICAAKLQEFSSEIKNKALINKCADVYYAKQLCMVNALLW